MTKRVRSVAMVFNHVRFANDILAHRIQLGMTTREVASMLETSPSLVSRYENAQEKNPHIQNVIAFCNIYDLDVRTYFELEL